MPRAFAMSWEGHPYCRWVKMYRGTRYRVHCSELGLPKTKWTREASAPAANAWWTQQRADLERADATVHPHARVLHELAERVRVGRAAGIPEAELKELVELQGFIQGCPAGVDPMVLFPGLIPTEPFEYPSETSLQEGPGLFVSQAPPEVQQAVWSERRRIVGKVKKERTVGVLAERWLTRRREKHEAGALTVSGMAQSKYRIDKFVAFVGGETSADTINADRWESWYNHIAGAVVKAEMSSEWAKNLFATSKMFVKWLWTTEVLASLPRNFDSLKLRGSPAKTIAVFKVPDVLAMLKAATPRFRLYLLLTLNAGLYQGDISELRRDEVDLKRGTITRQRGKTRRKGDVPIVTYPLWPETLELLREFAEREGEYALLNEDGKQLVRETLKADGTHSRTDAIRQAFDRLSGRVRVVGTIKMFRKTSASILNSNPKYRSIVPYFLGHAPRSIAERHYARESDDLLAEAINWLREEYGIGAG